MRRIWAAALVLAVAVPILRADDEKKEEPKSPKEQLAALRQDYLKERSAAMKEAMASEKSAQQKVYSEKKAALDKEFVPKFMEFAKANVGDDVGFEALMFVSQSIPGKPANEALDFMVEKFEDKVVSNPVILERAGAKGEKVIRTLRDKKSDGEPFVKLTVALANILKSPTEQADSDAAVAAALPKAKEAEKLYEEAIVKAKDIKTVARDVATAKANLEELQKLGIGKTMQDIETKDIDDKTVKISDFRGKVVVLDMWATWCGPCKAMIPHERELVKKMEGKPFVLISVSCDDKLETLTKFLEKEEMPWTHWFDGKGGPLAKGINLKYYPTVYVLDAKGVIRYRGPRGDKMDVAVEKLLKELESSE